MRKTLDDLKEKPLSTAEIGILHYIRLGWVLVRSYETRETFEGAYLQKDGVFDTYVPRHGFKSLVARGIFTSQGDVFSLKKDWLSMMPKNYRKDHK